MGRAAGTWRTTAVCLLVIVLATAVSFSPAANNEFVDWDDFQNLTRNEHIRSFSAENLYWMATTGHMGVWQPISWLVAAVQYRLFDGADEASFSRGIHIANIVLHAIACLLCLVVVRRLLSLGAPASATQSVVALNLGAMTATLIFAVHPLRVESVAWATAQPYILALIACLAAVWCYLRAYQSSTRRRWLMLSWICFGLSLMCKSIAVPLVLVLLLLDWYPLRRLGDGRRWWGSEVRGVWLEKIPYLMLAACVVVIAPLAKGGAASTMSLDVHGVAQRTAQACYGLVFYVFKTLLPLDLSPIYELRLPLDYTMPRYVVSALIVISVTLGLILVRRHFRSGLVAAASYTVLVFPVLGFLQSGNQEVADRYSYLPCMAWSVLIGAGLMTIWRGGRTFGWIRIAAGVVTVLAVVSLSVLTWRQCGIWRSTASLWTHAAALQSDSSLAQNGYGYALLQQGELDDAATCFRRAIRIKADNDMAHYNLWNALRQQGKTDELIEAYRHSSRVFPDMAEAHYKLGNIYFRRRQYADAISGYRQALAIVPDHARTHSSLAGALYATGDNQEAIRHARVAIKADPAMGIARYNLALALKAEGRVDEAITELRETLRLDPANTNAQRVLEEWTKP
ncbi:MAG: tetratricopeptide repeat protein [Planctomycetota bacterium]